MWSVPRRPLLRRAWFAGARKYTDVGKRKVPHVPMASAVKMVERCAAARRLQFPAAAPTEVA